MNRTLLAVALAASTAIVNLTGAPPARAADPECRYVMPHASAREPMSDNVLMRFGPVDGRNDGATRSFTMRESQWSVLGIRPLGTADYDIRVVGCPHEKVLGVSAYGAAMVDFIALDGNQTWPAQDLFTEFYRYPASEHGTFNAEYSTGGEPLAAGTSQTLALRGTPAVVRDVHVVGGTTTTIRMRVVSGSADLFLVESTAGDSATWVRPRVQAIASSANPGSADESITISLPAGVRSKTYGLVVANNADSGEYVLVRS